MSFDNILLCNLFIQRDDSHPHRFTPPSIQTSRGQTAADGSVEAGLTDAWIWIKHATQLDLVQPGYLSVVAPLILEWQLITVEHQ